MADTTTENLVIDIKVNDHDAATKIAAISSAVRRLGVLTNSRGLATLSQAAKNIRDLAGASTRLNAAAKNFDAISTSTSALLNTFRGFGTSAGVQQITSATDALTRFGDAASAVSASSASMKEMSGSLQSMVTSIQSLPQALQAFDKNGMGSLFSSGMDAYSKNVGKVIKNMSDGLAGVDTNAFNSVSRFANGLKTLSNLSKNADLGTNLKGLVGDIANFANSLSNAIPDDVIARIERLGNAFANLRLNMRDASGGTSGGTKDGLISIGDVAKAVGSDFKRLASYGNKVAKLPFKMLYEPMKGLASRVADLARGFDNLFNKIGRVALMRGIRAAIKMVTAGIREGVNDLYLWASAVGNSFKPTMDSLASSFLYLKNSIGAAVSPILDALAPAVEIAVNKLVELINVFNQVIATLTGASTWRKAIRSAADYSDGISGLGHDAQDANDAVKELKRTLLGFDEINRLDDKTKTISKGSNGKDPTGYYAKDGAFSFTEMPISSSVENFAQKLRDAWDRADFTEIGTMIGEKVGKALLDVPWESDIQPAVEKLATSFGTLLNGMFDYTGSGGKAMWDGIAYTIYSAINTALLGRVTFFKTVNWNGIGQGIGSALSDVVYNINWDLVAQNLSAFPNAVIDAITGFCTQMSPADFHQAGIKIGGSVADALIDIKWDDLFQDGFKMADRLLQAINGVLEGFGTRWGEIKTGIINGIKSVSPDEWAKIGTDIGKLIFNAASFVGNMVDLLVSAVKEGKWASLLNGIWTGIDEKIKLAYGSWAGAALALGRWIMSNLDIISLALAFSIGSFTIKETAAYLAKEVLGKIKLLPTAEQGLTFGDWIKNISLVAGIVLAISTVKSILSTDFSNQDTLTSIRTSAVLGLKGALSGALIGLKFGGLQGALIGATVGFLLTMSISELKSAADKIKTNPKAFMLDLAGGLIGAGIGFMAGGPLGAAFGFTIGVTLTMLITDIIPEFAHGAENDAKAVLNGTPNDPSHLELFGDLYSGMPTGNSKKSSSESSSKPMVEVPVKPVVKDTSPTLAEQVSTTWGKVVNGEKFEPFETKGLETDPSLWTIQLDTGWNPITKNHKTQKFQTNGLNDDSTTWWQQLVGFWGYIVALNKAGKFTVGGVKNDSATWWSQVSTAWTDYTRDTSLSASVTIGSALTLWNVFAAAFNVLQGFFNQNPLTAVVQTSSTSGSTVSTKNSGGNKRASKATGGVYKNGSWHDVTQYAGGGYPGSGELFIAREQGPELVGMLAGSTAVMNNDQIVSSVSDGVARAVAAVLGGSQRDSVNDITIKVDSEVLYRAMKKGERKANGRYGTVVTVG